MANGIGAYYSPTPLRPVPSTTAGLGAYYSPLAARPVKGLGETSTTVPFLAVVGILVVGFLLMSSGKASR